MSTQQSNNESTGNAPTPAGGNNAKPKNEQDNGGGEQTNLQIQKERKQEIGKIKIRIKGPTPESMNSCQTLHSRISKTDRLTSTDL